MKLKIKNIFGEKLDVLVTGNVHSKNILLLVHGFGTDKNEGFSSFLDMSKYFSDDFLVYRFDQSGYGSSQGLDVDFQFQKAAGDVDSVIRYVRKRYPEKDINIVAHSLGTFIVSLLSPFEIRKIVFTSIPNSNSRFVINALKNRIRKAGGTINEDGISIYPRSSGAVQKIGKDFWRTFKNFSPVEFLKDLARKTDLVVYKPMDDDVLQNKFFDEYKKIDEMEYIEVKGNHNFTNSVDRTNLFVCIKKFLTD